MTLQQIKYVLMIARCGSISEAAKLLFVSQPSLSAALKEIEDEYDIRIFDRSAKGITVTSSGDEFLAYARQISDQMDLLDSHYARNRRTRAVVSISTQHYAFAVQALVNKLREVSSDEYEFTFRECRTYEIMDDVARMRSDLGILYLSNFNEKVITRQLQEFQLVFTPLFKTKPGVFISRCHPLSSKTQLTLEELEGYPFLCFDQGLFNSFYYAEEPLSTVVRSQVIKVSDRATLFNCLIGLNGYTICSGILNEDLNGKEIVSRKLASQEYMEIGYIVSKKGILSPFAQSFIEELKKLTQATV